MPKPVAAEVEEVQRNDPEMLSRILFYALTHRTIFDHLATRVVLTSHDEAEQRFSGKT